MDNTKIKLTFSNGDEREYIVNDEAENKIKKGELFTINTQHPDHGERLIIDFFHEQYN